MAIHSTSAHINVKGLVVRSLTRTPICSRFQFYQDVKDMTETQIVGYVKSHHLNFLQGSDSLAAIKIRKVNPKKYNQNNRSTCLTKSIVILSQDVVFRTTKIGWGKSRPGDRHNSRLGAGFHKVVWKVENLCNGKLVAIAQAGFQTGIESIKKEYNVTQEIDSPYILKVQTYGVRPEPDADNHPRKAHAIRKAYAVSELCQCSLQDDEFEKCHPHPEFITQLEEAFQAVHDAGFVHQDAHLGNVFVAMDGKARLTDFGCATRIPDDLRPAPHTVWEDLTQQQRKELQRDHSDLRQVRNLFHSHFYFTD